VTADALVWRDDWTEWRSAGAVIAELKANLGGSPSPFNASNFSQSTEFSEPAIYAASREPAIALAVTRSARKMTGVLLLSGGLILLLVILTVIVIF
jgi:hypothetical protein